MSREPQRDSIDAKIERSSLGTAEARRLRAGVATATARTITSRAAAYARPTNARNRKSLGGDRPSRTYTPGERRRFEPGSSAARGATAISSPPERKRE
jgi:hypothetical protein